ncbi:MAG: alpha/beta hydrolase [Pseudomonadota bacterium]|nr:alpha/beta hydrolase [Sphingomonas sp.]MDQ3478512.1 alpha/beta hydrolase [Pseudomonadota bacterium]
MKPWSDRYWTSRDGLKLHYRDYDGPADRPPLLCLHGLTRNSRDFESLAERYAGQWRVIAPDFRGRGQSQHDPQPANYAPPTYALDVVELLDALEVSQAVFVGTSLGGLVTMAVAAFAARRIVGAVLNDVGPELDPAGLERIRTYVGKPVRFGSWEEAAAAFQDKFGAVHPRYGRLDWLRYAKRVARETKAGVELDYDMAIAEPFSTIEAEPAPDAWPLLEGLAGRPVLILRGESSDLLSPAVAERMRDSVPGAELVSVPGVGHAPDFDEPETIEALDRLLQRVLGDTPKR